MTAPTTNFVQVEHKNPDAQEALILSLEIIPNTPIEELGGNINQNSRKYGKWLQLQERHDRPAVLVGGGPSINDHIEDIRKLSEKGEVFALNAASQWCRKHGIRVDYQVIVDAKPETAELVDPEAPVHLFASQCNPATLDAAKNVLLWHLDIGDVEQYMPAGRVKSGGYVLVGGDATVGNCAICGVYTQGYRDLHVFGYDSSHRNGRSHAYDQQLNLTMPTIETEWAGRKFQISIAMKNQAERFMVYAHALKSVGCTINVYGDGLLQHVWNTKPQDLSEREKYQLMYNFDSYREKSPGELILPAFLNFHPEGRIIDFGCGTGRAGLRMAEQGYEVLLLDFTDNSRDQETQHLPFLQWDMTDPIPRKAEYGFCADVMEHIPEKDVDTVIKNIMDSVEKCFFQISTVHELHGEKINAILHVTVKNPEWWLEKFKDYKIEYKWQNDIALVLYVSRIS